MSHFSVLVITKTPGEVESVLQPFHEYECTGTKDQYVVWVDQTKEMETEFNEKTIPMIFQDGKMLCRKWNAEDHNLDVNNLPVNCEIKDTLMKEIYASIVEMAIHYHGYDEDNFRADKIGRVTNPNSKWDWWVIGGRWSDFLHLKSGGKADQAQKKDIDFEAPKQEARARAKESYARAKTALGSLTFIGWDEVRDKKFPGEIDKARDFYKDQEAIKALRAEFKSPWLECDDFLLDEETYLHNAELSSISTYAVIKDGKWLAHGEMGWWGLSSDENDSWQKDFGTILDSIPEDMFLTVVDCHI